MWFSPRCPILPHDQYSFKYLLRRACKTELTYQTQNQYPNLFLRPQHTRQPRHALTHLNSNCPPQPWPRCFWAPGPNFYAALSSGAGELMCESLQYVEMESRRFYCVFPDAVNYKSWDMNLKINIQVPRFPSQPYSTPTLARKRRWDRSTYYRLASESRVPLGTHNSGGCLNSKFCRPHDKLQKPRHQRL